MDHAKSLHYVGAGVAFPAGLLFVCLQCVLTYRVAVTALDYWMAHFRVALAMVAMVSLVLSILSSRYTHYTLSIRHRQTEEWKNDRSQKRIHVTTEN